MNMEDAAIVSGSDMNGNHGHDNSSSSDDDDFSMETSNAHPQQDTQHDNNDDSDDDSNASDNSDEEHDYGIPKDDILYNPNQDDEDEAWVMKHMRGGIEENITIRRTIRTKNDNKNGGTHDDTHLSNHNESTSATNHSHPTSATTAATTTVDQWDSIETAKILKSRNSDAILSCPCCFQIVCMDCQRHERYSNQFRAMFVMSIGVDFSKTIQPETIGNNNNNNSNDSSQKNGNEEMKNNSLTKNDLQKKNNGHHESDTIPPCVVDNKERATMNEQEDSQEVYYSVHCNRCHTEVAALNMEDEVYHFFGCLVSG